LRFPSKEQRARWLVKAELWLEIPMLVLALVWLVLLILELVAGLPTYLESVGIAIWIVFVVDFLGRLLLSPDRGQYLRCNWLTAVALLVPPLRVLRILAILRFTRILSATRFLRLFRITGSLNRGIRSIGARLRRRGLVYVLAISLVMFFVLSAGIYSYERPGGSGTMASFAEAMWTTAVIMTTLGPETWPQTWEARALGLVAAVFGFATFGYLTAALASFFVGREPEKLKAEAPRSGEPVDEAELRESIRVLSSQLARLEASLARDGEVPGPEEEQQ
jgi:voltage-gated potassium channel